MATPLLNWPLRVSLLVQRPLLDSFGWHCYAEVPMLYPPTTPRMVGLYMVTGIAADPNGVTFNVRGGGLLRYDVEPDRRLQSPLLVRSSSRIVRAVVRPVVRVSIPIAIVAVTVVSPLR